METTRLSLREQLETLEQRPGVLFLGQAADVQKQFLIGADAQSCARVGCAVGTRTKNVDVHSEIYDPQVTHSPIPQHVGQTSRGHERRFELVVKIPHITAPETTQPLARRPAPIFFRAAPT